MQQDTIDNIYKISISAGTSILIANFPLSFILPVSVSFENGSIENLQVLILVLNSILSFKLFKMIRDSQTKIFNLWCSALSILLACRELSWGRVFYPIGMEKCGPIFIDMSDYIWRNEAHIFIILYILILTLMLVKMPIIRMIRCRPPYLVASVMSIAVILAYVGEHAIFFNELQGQIIEEFAELSFYVMIPALCIYYNRKLSHKLEN